jgi:phosphopantothenoylcysteine decarboxylase
MHKFPSKLEEAKDEISGLANSSESRESTIVKEPFDSSRYRNDNKHHLLLCASGSVATIKIVPIISELSKHDNLSIRLILTSSATQFLQGQSAEQPSIEEIRKMKNVDGIYMDEDEWAIPWTRGAKILHIELRRWSDLMVVAPLSANTLAKVVNGLCDNLLLSTFRAWDTTSLLDLPHVVSQGVIEKLGRHENIGREDVRRKKKIFVAVAMNSAMLVHPVTQKQMAVLEEDWNIKNGGWIDVLHPVEKELACGDTGSGAMADWKTIVKRIEDEFGLR